METYKFLNPHPQGKLVGDCVKRAICIATGMEYEEVQLSLNRVKRITKCDKFNDNKNWKYYVEKELNGRKISFPAISGRDRMNGFTFAETYTKGSYILRMAGHLCACVDGVIYDTWDCRDKCVYMAYKVNRVNGLPKGIRRII